MRYKEDKYHSIYDPGMEIYSSNIYVYQFHQDG